jgi:ATP-dependent Clp protease ATP-binding subunit ClpC
MQHGHGASLGSSVTPSGWLRQASAGMFERFTAPARQMVGFAQDEARLLEHNYIGSEHLLLGMLRSEEGVAADVLKELGITLERVRGVVRMGGSDAEPASDPLRSPRAPRRRSNWR